MNSRENIEVKEMVHYLVTMDNNAGILMKFSKMDPKTAVRAACESLEKRYLEKNPKPRSIPLTGSFELDQETFAHYKKEVSDRYIVNPYEGDGVCGVIFEYPERKKTNASAGL